MKSLPKGVEKRDSPENSRKFVRKFPFPQGTTISSEVLLIVKNQQVAPSILAKDTDLSIIEGNFFKLDRFKGIGSVN
jgi:hypothetical protein